MSPRSHQRQLVLQRQTVRLLSRPDLGRVAAGTGDGMGQSGQPAAATRYDCPDVTKATNACPVQP